MLATLAASSMISLREQPFRTPSPVAVSTPETEPGRRARSRRAPRRAVARWTFDHPGRASPTGEVDSVLIIRDPASLGQNSRTAHLPDRALLEESRQFGPLPDARRRWQAALRCLCPAMVGRARRPHRHRDRRARPVADRHAERHRKLPGEVTLGFVPHGNSLDRWMQAARRDGHESCATAARAVRLSAVNPGRNTLTVGADPGENLDSLLHSLGRITNYVGVMNYMGGRFTPRKRRCRR
jgi:uncharacterized protein